jgi:hypothetical protein
MPQCPHCQAPYEKGQRYCSVCGSFLLHPEQGDTFCPQCGVRVSSRQQFCHECDAPLDAALREEAVETPQTSEEAPRPAPAPESSPSEASKGLPSWAIGVLAGGGIIIIILLILLFSRTTPPPPPPAVAPKTAAPAPAPAPSVTTTAPAAPGTAPAAATAPLKEQLQKVLNVLRDAQLKKNITEFMSVYSTTFPGFDEKREKTTESWENYDYVNLVFTVDKVQSIDADNALAWVTWYMDLRNRKNQELSSATQTYQVRFVKELGHWRIRQIEEAE